MRARDNPNIIPDTYDPAHPIDMADVRFRNQTIHRRLAIATFDASLETFCNRTGLRNLANDIQHFHDAHEDYGISKYWALTSPKQGMSPYGGCDHVAHPVLP